jgi:SAM-dependent methyltransferase
MLAFSGFDRRHYPTVPVSEGYRDWAETYEATVLDRMDLALLDRLATVAWPEVVGAADLGCGTGRTGAWLKGKGVGAIDGIDLTREMLAKAKARALYRSLAEADLAVTGLAGGAYDLVATCLVDEHLADLRPLYREAHRLLRPGGRHVLVGYHPHFIMAAGIPTHFNHAKGEPVAIETHVHLFSDHAAAALGAGFALAELIEAVVDEGWIALKPRWAALRNHPISFAMVWRKA